MTGEDILLQEFIYHWFDDHMIEVTGMAGCMENLGALIERVNEERAQGEERLWHDIIKRERERRYPL